MEDILAELNNKEYIAKLKNLYDISFCELGEIDEVIQFIDIYWRKNHIFTKDRVLLNWQHLDTRNSRYNFVIARSRSTNEIHAILGFLPTYQFDYKIKNVKVWPCIWKVIDNLGIRGLGVSLFYYLKENLAIEVIEILGISEIALKIYKKWGFDTGQMSHYFLLNNKLKKFNIIKNISKKGNKSKDFHLNHKVIKINKTDFLEIENNFFKDQFKSKSYYINRFFNHPKYLYDFYMISSSTGEIAIIITRFNFVHESKCIRIVDYIGDKKMFSYTKSFFSELVETSNSEYIDFVVSGWTKEIILKAGFVDRRDSEVIVPNYFEPFVMKNIDLDYAIKSVTETEFNLYKADSDQDRPNL